MHGKKALNFEILRTRNFHATNRKTDVTCDLCLAVVMSLGSCVLFMFTCTIHMTVTSFKAGPLNEFLFLENFAGAARLSIIAGETDFRNLPIDKSSERCQGAHVAVFHL